MEQSTTQALSFSIDEGSHLHARFDPAGGMPVPDPATMKQALTDKGWAALYLDDKAVDDFIMKCRGSTQPLDMVVGARRDGEFSLTADSDLMTAWLTLVPPQGGQAVAAAAIDNALREQGIIYGIDRAAIDAAFAASYCERVAVACGTPAREGTPTRFETLFDQEDDASEDDELDRIKYADLSHLLLVQPGDKLMRRIPPAPGKNGSNIKGHPLLPQPTPELPFAADLQGAERDQNDSDLLIATQGGQPTAKSNGVMVNSVIDVTDVDLSTGNIEFEGTLRVGGDVKAGMRIKVSGDVIVNGTVEAAEIIAGGNVAVRGGVVGHPDSRPGSHALPETTARILCDGSAQALFMETAHVEAGKSILITRSARQCELIARDEIVVGKGKTGQIAGGRTQATRRIATGILGGSTGIKTQVQVGFDPYLEKQIADKDALLKRRFDEIDRVVKLLAYFKHNPKKGEGGVAEKVEGTRRQLMADIDALTAELNALREQMEMTEQSQVEVGATIHYGVEIRIAQQSWQAPDDMTGAVIQLRGSRIAAGS